MATLNKTVSGIHTNGSDIKPSRMVVRLSEYKKVTTLETSTYDGVSLAVPIDGIKSDLIKALGE